MRKLVARNKSIALILALALVVAAVAVSGVALAGKGKGKKNPPPCDCPQEIQLPNGDVCTLAACGSDCVYTCPLPS